MASSKEEKSKSYKVKTDAGTAFYDDAVIIKGQI